MKKLTEKMKEALLLIGFGVRGYPDGFYSEEDPNKRLDLRSADALMRRGLVSWHTRGGCPNITIIDLTEAGWTVFYELNG